MSSKENLEQFFANTDKIIHEAEDSRTSGKRGQAVRLVRPARVSPQLIPEFSDWQLSNLMRAWRIDVVSHTSEAKRSLTGRKAARHLREARHVIKRYYDHPKVLEKSIEFAQDTEGTSYDFDAAIIRDKGEFCLAAAAITGNVVFAEAAMNFFHQAIAVATEDRTEEGLALMEVGIQTNDYQMIQKGFQLATLRPENVDRTRYASVQFLIESSKRRKFTNVRQAFSKITQLIGLPAGLKYTAILMARDLIKKPLRLFQRATLPKDFNSESLKIS